MSVVKEFIVLEERFEELFNKIPDIVKPGSNPPELFKVFFDFGDENDLLEYIRENDNNYPLIWLETPYEETQRRSRVDFENLNLIIALNSKENKLNKERILTNFKPILLKAANDIKYIFEKANIIYTTDVYKMRKFYRYSVSNKENTATCVWDALKMTVSGYMNDKCLREITFRNV